MLQNFLEELGDECPVCGMAISTTIVRGPDDIILVPCGHRVGIPAEMN